MTVPPWVAGFVVGEGAEAQVRCGGAVVDAGCISPDSMERVIIVATAAHCLTQSSCLPVSSPSYVFFGQGDLASVPPCARLRLGAGDDGKQLSEAVSAIETDLALIKVKVPADYCGEFPPPPAPEGASGSGPLEAFVWGSFDHDVNELKHESGLVRSTTPDCLATIAALWTTKCLRVVGSCFESAGHVCEPNSSGGPVLSGGNLAGVLSAHMLGRCVFANRWIAKDSSMAISTVFEAARACGRGTWRGQSNVRRVGRFVPTQL